LKQVVQENRTGRLRAVEAPAPAVRPGYVLIANQVSLISAGTERTLRELARKSLVAKAAERPDQVRRVLEKVAQEGLLSAVAQVRARLDEPMPLGYCSAGVVLACGSGVQEYRPGDRVASNGPHAGVVCVPRHLCARVPDGVSLDHAAFTVLGAIALQGVRLARIELGETALVVGLGLVGQLAVALFRAAGVRVLAVDPQPGRCALALELGASVARPDLAAPDVASLTGGLGADAVLLTASTPSQEPMTLAADAVRKKGRIVLVGVVGLTLDRRPFYMKECEFVVSCSYGPGRYDPEYEERGRDYPPAYVRWTEQRNMQATLDLMADGRLDVAPLITHRFPIDRADEAYELIEQGTTPHLGVLLEYPRDEPVSRRVELARQPAAAGSVGYACLGAGSFARAVLLPALKTVPALTPVLLCSAGSMGALHSATALGFAAATTDEDEVFRDERVRAVFVLTRHDQHARQVARALRAGRHVFTEKPLCLSFEELEDVEAALAEAPGAPLLMVGFNRRFSAAARKVREFVAATSAPLTVAIRFNAGAIPAEHWTQNEEVGGGRILGEACHAIDLATFLTGSPPVRVFAESVGGERAPQPSDDQCFITLRHADGSVSSIGYLSGGDRAFPKERVEVFGGGRVAVIDDFREVILCSGGRTKRSRGWQQDKGHRAEVEAFARVLTAGGAPPIPWAELRAVTRATLGAVQSLRSGLPVEV
jgi:predicted dehydrogenase/threonine dehydrogenase-like Zn-dependent dehydrogenase